MGSENWDVVVIGGGAGGVAAAVRARQLGAKVAIIEKEHLGGVCMNRGCIPTKSLMETARLYRAIQRSADFGLKTTGLEVDWDAVMAKKDDLVKYLRMGTEAILKSNGVEIVRGEATFVDPLRIRVNDRELEIKSAIVATGSTWSPPSIPGIDGEGVITTDELLTMRKMPSSVVVLGSGPVELEAAQYFLFLGAKVTLIEPEARILPQEDREIARRLASALREQGMDILTGARVTEIRREPKGLALRLEVKEGEKLIAGERALYAQRSPSVSGLGLGSVGVAVSDEGIPVDSSLRTPLPHVLAIGDVTGGPMYSHRASAMGVLAAENAMGETRSFRPNRIPRAYYTHPEVAAIGISEREAKQQGLEVQVATIPFSISARAMMMLETDGAVKVVAEARYGEILGVHIVGPHATELIGEGALAMETEATVEDLARAVRLHPSLSESQVDAAREALGRGIYLLR
jgi:dihydrolipoamide dehydrogenase